MSHLGTYNVELVPLKTKISCHWPVVKSMTSVEHDMKICSISTTVCVMFC